jgi:5'-nucleotidase
MKFLVTNDDGIAADGLAALLSAARPFGTATVVAPAEPQSGVSHFVTTEGPLRVTPHGPERFAVHGSPADCSRIGLLELVPDADWVISGINHGGNLGADVYYSGTVAAVREAVLHGWTGAAFSQYRKRELPFDWNRAAGWVSRVLRELLERPPERGAFYNVNLPNLGAADPEPRIVYCPLDPHPLPLTYRHTDDHSFQSVGDYHSRLRSDDADVAVCFGGDIAVTLLKLY